MATEGFIVQQGKRSEEVIHIIPFETTPLSGLLPDTLNGWSAAKTVPLLSPKDLYEYMDGGAELYLSYGFGEALSRTYSSTSNPEVVVEIYDLLESRNAFGVFTQVREKESLLFGQAAYAIPGALLFWKNRYYISISAWEPSIQADKFISEIAAFINSKITAEGQIPEVVSLLPPEGMIPSGFHYFHHPVWVNSYFFITDENIFAIDDKTDAVIARYEEREDQRKYLLIIRYPVMDMAKEAYLAFEKEFFPEGLTGNCLQTEDGKWLGAYLSGSTLIAVFNAASRDSTTKLLNQAIAEVIN